MNTNSAINNQPNLEELIHASLTNPQKEREVFRALLDHIVYVLMPFDDKPGRMRFVQFEHPDRKMFIPVFTDRAKAQFAARGNTRVTPMSGRTAMELTRGATLMIDPNDTNCMLYPEEVEVLLKDGEIAPIQKDTWRDSVGLVGSAVDAPGWLTEALSNVCGKMEAIESAYLIRVAPVEEPTRTRLLVVLGVEDVDAERACRACVAACHRKCVENNVPLDAATYRPSSGEPSYLSGSGATPFFKRPTVSRLATPSATARH